MKVVSLNICCCLLFVVTAINRAESAYQWGCSAPNDESHVFLPNVHLQRILTPHIIAAREGFLYVYHIPATLNCSGTVVGIEFCYKVMGNDSMIFDLLQLMKVGNQFNITSPVSHFKGDLTEDSCSGQFCCKRSNVSSHIQLSGDQFAFGISIPREDSYILLPLQGSENYRTTVYEYNSDVAIDPEVGYLFNISTDVPVEPPPVFMRFVVAVESTVTTISSPTSGEAPSEAPITTVTSTTASGTESQRSDNILPTVVGIVIAVVITMVLVIVSVILVVMCIRKKNSEWDLQHQTGTEKQTTVTVEDGREGFSNAVYSSAISTELRDSVIPLIPGANIVQCSTTVNYDYASEPADTTVDSKDTDRGNGYEEPHEYATADELREIKQTAESTEYAYADTGPSALPSTTSRYSYSSSGGNLKPRLHSGSLTDAIYMAPARDENSLYAQFNEIKIKELLRSSISVQEELGSGQFGTVHKAEWKMNTKAGSRLVAVKTLKTGADETDKVKFLQEAAIMGQFSHPNVVKLYGIVITGEPLMIVLELLPQGDLRNHLIACRDESNESVDEHTLLSYCRQVASGMTYLSNKQFIHRDLAARNILVSDDGVCKIADFGMSRDITDETYYISHGGKIPVRWTAPEALHYKKYSTASDVWSFGCVMYEIWSLGHKPFEAFSNNQTISEVDEGYRLAPPPGCPRIIYRLMIQCWHPLKSERPTFTELMQELSLPDTKLLKWSKEDKAVHPEASVLGAQLNYTEDLYLDLQERYIVENKPIVGSYEVPFESPFDQVTST